MTSKAIIGVDIDPEGKFKAFYDMFKEYQGKLEAMPEDWKKINNSIADSHKEFADAFGVLSASTNSSARETRALVEHLKEAANAQKSFKVETGKSKDMLEQMGKSAKQLGKELFGIGSYLFKVGAIGVGLSAGGIYGMDKLAGNVVGNQRSARGLGMTTGQYKAFSTDFGRYLDPSITSNIADAQNSFSGRMYLGMATGMGQNDLASMDPGAVAAKLSLRAHDWWQNTPANMRTSEALQATGFMQSGLSLADMRRLGNTSTEDLQKAGSQYAQDQGNLNTSDKDTDAWYELERQIKLAGQTIETDLTNHLVALAPSLKDFVSTITEDVDNLIKNVLTPENMKSLADGIGDITTYLGSPQFKQDMKDFGSAIGDIVGFLRKAGILHAVDPAPASLGSLDPNEVQRETHGRVTGSGNAAFAAPSATEIALGKVRHALNSQSNGDERKYLAEVEKKNGLPPGTLLRVWAMESGEGGSLVGPKLKSGDQAIGDFQFTAETWSQYGKGGDRFSFRDEANAAGVYTAALKKKYGGDIRKALAAYNWGPGNLDKDIAANGNKWDFNMPKQTRDYIGSPPNLNVNITNSTTAKVATSMNAAPH